MTHEERDIKAVSHSREYSKSEALILDDLVGMLEADSFVRLGYPSLFVYCVERLHLSEAQAGYFQRVARKSLIVPELKLAIEQGEISLSEGRRIESVITPENHEEWIGKARDLSQKELEQEVAEVNPQKKIREKIKPVCKDRKEMKVGISNDLEKKLLRIKDLLSQKLKKAVTLEEAIAAMADGFLERNDPLQKKPSSRKTKPPKPGRHPIPQALKNQVHKRDQSQCTAILPTGTRCPGRRFLQIHHEIPVEWGGLNTIDNLKLLCSAHHKADHGDHVGRALVLAS